MGSLSNHLLKIWTFKFDPALPSLPSAIQATLGPPYTQLSTWNMPSWLTLGPDFEADPAINPVKWEIYKSEATWLPSANVVVRVREVWLWFPGIVIKYLIGEGQALPSWCCQAPATIRIHQRSILPARETLCTCRPSSIQGHKGKPYISSSHWAWWSWSVSVMVQQSVTHCCIMKTMSCTQCYYLSNWQKIWSSSTEELILGVLKISHMWMIPAGCQYAVSELAKLELSAAWQLELARMFDITGQICPALADIILKRSPKEASIDYQQWLTMHDIGCVHCCCQSPQGDPGWTWLPCSSSSTPANIAIL